MKNAHILDSEWQVFHARVRILNAELLPILLGVIGIAVSSRSPLLFGMLGGIFLIYHASRRLRRFDGIYEIWRKARHPLLTLRVAGPHLMPFFSCWLFLGLVMTGVVSVQ